ncbi:lytic transglycosylase domain-containing protein [Nocardia sp. NPDC051570]|uniref:lytic transglycosylase domain-containing protein n=1 Tax=Nocardia sp. NPDC051570 TaxID=3364324 RepID=UPI0037B33D39
MRIPGPLIVTALVVAGLTVTGSTARTAAPATRDLADSAPIAGSDSEPDPAAGLVPAAPQPPRKLRELTPPADGALPADGSVPLRDILLPGGAALGIPEIVLAAYRNAELALQNSEPNCGLPWYLLAGIGKIESNHAGNGRVDPTGTTIGTIFGPALDGTLAGNQTIRAAGGGFVRAVGPMQFLPGTWATYASDGNADGKADPNNVFDAALAAGKYLCSDNTDLRDPKQELRAILRYNNSSSYASEVMSWANAYMTGGAPVPVGSIPDPLPPNGAPEGTGSSMSAGDTVLASATFGSGGTAPDPNATTDPATTTTDPTTTDPTTTDPSTSDPGTTTYPTTTDPTNPPGVGLSLRVWVKIGALPPFQCGIFCTPPAPNPCPPLSLPTLPTDPAAQPICIGPSDTSLPAVPTLPTMPPLPTYVPQTDTPTTAPTTTPVPTFTTTPSPSPTSTPAPTTTTTTVAPPTTLTTVAPPTTTPAPPTIDSTTITTVAPPTIAPAPTTPAQPTTTPAPPTVDSTTITTVTPQTTTVAPTTTPPPAAPRATTTTTPPTASIAPPARTTPSNPPTTANPTTSPPVPPKTTTPPPSAAANPPAATGKPVTTTTTPPTPQPSPPPHANAPVEPTSKPAPAPHTVAPQPAKPPVPQAPPSRPSAPTTTVPVVPPPLRPTG